MLFTYINSAELSATRAMPISSHPSTGALLDHFQIIYSDLEFGDRSANKLGEGSFGTASANRKTVAKHQHTKSRLGFRLRTTGDHQNTDLHMYHASFLSTRAQCLQVFKATWRGEYDVAVKTMRVSKITEEELEKFKSEIVASALSI